MGDFSSIIIGIIVLCVIVIQILIYYNNAKSIGKLKILLPNVDSLLFNRDYNVIECENPNEYFRETLDDINAYLIQNKNKNADYQIIREIVERNSQKYEDEVDNMMSVPLYCGLMATILGVVIGVIIFAINGLDPVVSGSDVRGIKPLLMDIGIAMIASFVGVFLTAINTSRFKVSKSEISKYKNKFLTWIQTNVMPNMPDNLSSALNKMAQDLNYFNSTFADNTKELKGTLAMVIDSYDSQVKLLEAVDKIKIGRIAKANIEIYDHLQGCTDQIGKLSECLGMSEQYVSQVVELNSKLGDIDERTRLFENLGLYFQKEMAVVQDHQGMIQQAISKLDSVMQQAMEDLGLSMKTSISELTKVMQQQNQNVSGLIDEQQTSLVSQLNEQHSSINTTITALNEPFAPLKAAYEEIGKQSREGIKEIATTFASQNTQIEQMMADQRKLLEVELATQRETIAKQCAQMPSQWKELAKTLENLNKTIENQQNKIDSQTSLLEELAGRIVPGGKIKRGILSYIMPVSVCGIFILLLVMSILYFIR